MRAGQMYASEKQGNYYIFFLCLGVLFGGRTGIANMFVALLSFTGLHQAKDNQRSLSFPYLQL